MVARGDLGIEIQPELVPHIQKTIIAKCNAAYKPVITATQMLDSMIRNPRPTRAEVADVANAIYDGTDAVMLSGETAAGKYPVEAVRMQASIAHETEQHIAAHGPLEVPAGSHGTRVINNVVGLSAVNMATTIGAKAIIVPTTTGRSARLISHFHPKTPVVAFSRHKWAVQKMIMYWGVEPHYAAITQGTVDETVQKAIASAKEHGYVDKNDLAVVTVGTVQILRISNGQRQGTRTRHARKELRMAHTPRRNALRQAFFELLLSDDILEPHILSINAFPLLFVAIAALHKPYSLPSGHEDQRGEHTGKRPFSRNALHRIQGGDPDDEKGKTHSQNQQLPPRLHPCPFNV